MTQLSQKDHEAQMESMRAFDEQMPCVGIFWYDPEAHSFFGVHKKELTPVMVEEAANKCVFFIDYGESKAEKYAGRVVWSKNKFIVLVGKWAEPIQEELTELMEQEFSLPYFEFVYEPMEQREESEARFDYPES